jgi:hypothetical protein
MSLTEATEFVFAGFYPEGGFAAFTEFHTFGKLASVGVEGVAATECIVVGEGQVHVHDRGGDEGGSDVGFVDVRAVYAGIARATVLGGVRFRRLACVCGLGGGSKVGLFARAPCCLMGRRWDNGTKDASTKCGIQLWTPTTASYTCGSMDTYVCINADADIDFSTDLYEYFSTARFPVDAFQYLDSYNVRFFALMDMPR